MYSEYLRMVKVIREKGSETNGLGIGIEKFGI